MGEIKNVKDEFQKGSKIKIQSSIYDLNITIGAELVLNRDNAQHVAVQGEFKAPTHSASTLPMDYYSLMRVGA